MPLSHPPLLSSSSQGDCHVIAKKWHINEAPLRGSFLLMSPHKTIRWFEEGHGGRHLAHLIKQEERGYLVYSPDSGRGSLLAICL